MDVTSSIEELLGRVVPLRLRRLGPPGAFFELDPSSARTILLPGAEVPAGAQPGDELELFVYLDSEDRPVATLRAPKIVLAEVAFLEFTDVTRFGAFAGWGLAKDLLVPFAEQTRDVKVGDRHPVGLYLDDTGRLAGTMRVSELLEETGAFELDEWVEGESWRLEPEIGTFVILERKYVGLVPASEPHGLARGDAARFRVSHVQPDGKIELSLRGHAHEELEGDAARILAVLSRANAPRLGDRSDPDVIRAALGMSKKAFKRAAGRLLKQGDVTIDRDGALVVSRKG
jgi:predicted RNA-binding protein (virulence factor B family)